jgi:sigma-E factor negative regulatory protein RseA
MKESVSALMDGEIESQEEVTRILGSMERDDTLESAWDEYHLIGDAMRSNSLLSVDVSQQVAERLAAEPTVLAPNASRHRRTLPSVPLRTWALAASISFAAVIAWQQLKGPTPQAVPVAQRAVPAPLPSERDSAYLLAHQEMVNDPNLLKASVSEVRH